MTRLKSSVKSYKKQLTKAIDNRFLGKTLANFGAAYRETRRKAFTGFVLDELIDDVAKSKDSALANLQVLFEEFKEAAEKAGAHVHRARNAEEANELIAAIARAGKVKKIVKGKSMTAEETFLNNHLEAQGFQVTETDLGEWIIQLRHEHPSHMVLPAIHLSRRQVADLFGKVTGSAQDPENIDKMVKVARKELRQAFLEADMGITGANFAVADSGTLGIVTNEGNVRLVTTLPPVHVALVGFDKLVPNLATAFKILKVLPRNATGQAISSYVTWISGAVECKTGPDGRKETHIIFLDNGRLAIADDPIFSSALRCIRCGACANVCPIYQHVGGHNYGHVYIGAIGLILTYFYHDRDKARALITNCLNCQACKAVCPAGIDLPHLIKHVHRAIMDDDGEHPMKNRLLSRVLKNRKLFHFILRSAYLAQKPLARDASFLRHLPLFFGKEQDFRSLPTITRIPLRDQWTTCAKKISAPRLRVALFGGCLVDFVYPEQAKALLFLLNDHNIRVDYPLEQSCCGLPALMMAEHETAREVALQNISALKPANYDYIITLCASCGSHIKENFPKLLQAETSCHHELAALTEKIIDFSSFLIDVMKISSEEFKASNEKIAYHSPCHLCRGLKVGNEPRKLLKTAGLRYVPAKDEDVCCGFGGSYSVDFPELSAEILKQKLDNLEATGAELLVTDCPGCVLQLRGGLDKRDSQMKVKHIAEVIAAKTKKQYKRQRILKSAG
jgi:iron-sulfur cluster protein